MPNLKGMNVEALMNLRDQVDEWLPTVGIGVVVGIALAIINHRLLAALDMMGLLSSSSTDRSICDLSSTLTIFDGIEIVVGLKGLI